MVNFLIEFFCGSVAGAIGKIIDYPFDTVKVRMQTQSFNIFPTTWSCIQYTYNNEGIIDGFFKGISSPLIGAIIESATLFMTYDQCFDFLSRYTSLNAFMIILMSGAWAGSCTSLVLTPVELIKCQLQVSNLKMALHDQESFENHQIDEIKERHTSLIGTIRFIIEEKGFLGLWQGQTGTFIRESIGSLIWFTTYELLKAHFMSKNQDINSWQLIISGGLAGFIFNFSMFPVDTIKSLQQIEHLSFIHAASRIKDQQGLSGFYRGLGITLVRAFPSNAAIFYVHEKLSDWLL